MQFEDWTGAYRLFEKERMDRQSLFASVMEATLERLPQDAPLVVAMDDTLVRKRGKKVHGAAWKRDPLGPPFHTNFVWGQRFLQLSAVLPDKDCLGRARGIPIDFIHAPSAAKPKKGASAMEQAEYRRQKELMKVTAMGAVRLKELAGQTKGRQVVCAVDGGYTNKTVFREIPEKVTLIGRIRKDAKLYTVPDEGMSSGRGRPRWYGERLPTPEGLRQDESVPWTKVEAYAAGTQHQFNVKTMPAVRWEGSGERTMQVVVIRPLAYRPRKGAKLLYREPAYLICSDSEMPLEEVLQAYLWRWEVELNFRDEKTVLGVGEAQVRHPSAVEAVPAFIVASYAFLLLAGERNGKAVTLRPPKWHPPKEGDRMTTQQMQGVFRAELWNLGTESNKTGFDSAIRKTRTAFYSNNALKSAVCYAYK
jgi:hypothetical protein